MKVLKGDRCRKRQLSKKDFFHCLTLVPEANKPDTKPKRNVLALVVETLDSAQNPPDKSLSRG